jgi:5-methylcytosine-specific restriction protein A
MRFVQGESYTRDFIHDQLGGEKVSYLPQKAGRIVCGCFSTESNPEAPYEILVGGAEEDGSEGPILRKAKLLARQDGSIPVFLKRAANQWMYDGRYRVNRLIEDREYVDRKQRIAGRSDVVLALVLEPAEQEYDTYLLTWNPRHWPWTNLEEMVELTARGRSVDDQWSCGNTKRIRAGDRLFLMRQGEEPKGIMAAGWATSGTYEGPHWDVARRERGDKTLYVDLRFERILDPDVDEILTLDRLQDDPLASVNWATPASGIQIKQGTDHLERLWSELVGQYGGIEVGAEVVGAVEGEMRMAVCRHRARERWLRDAKIAQAKAAHDGRLPCEVPGCGFDFFEVYGEIGRDYAQVHHLGPLGDRTRPSQTRLSDLAVVCANCHSMIHRGGESRPLEDLLGPG